MIRNNCHTFYSAGFAFLTARNVDTSSDQSVKIPASCTLLVFKPLIYLTCSILHKIKEDIYQLVQNKTFSNKNDQINPKKKRKRLHQNTRCDKEKRL